MVSKTVANLHLFCEFTNLKCLFLQFYLNKRHLKSIFIKDISCNTVCHYPNRKPTLVAQSVAIDSKYVRAYSLEFYS